MSMRSGFGILRRSAINFAPPVRIAGASEISEHLGKLEGWNRIVDANNIDFIEKKFQFENFQQ